MARVADVTKFACDDMGLYDPDTKEKLMRALRLAWYAIMREHPWQFVRRSTTLTTATGDTQGGLLPANAIGIIDPVEDADGNRYFRRDAAGTPTHDDHYWYSLDAAAITPLLESARAVSIVESAAGFTLATAWSAGYVGEYALLGDEPGMYLISGTNTLAESYWGPRLDSKAIVIRPRECMSLTPTDGSGARIEATLTVHYWAYPAPLYHDWQTLPDYLVEPLRWLTLIHAKGHIVDQKQGLVATRYEPMYQSALARAIVQNPTGALTAFATDNRGKRRSMGRRD